MKTELYIRKISNDQLITENKEKTIETYLVVDYRTSAPDFTVSVIDVEGELVGWIYDHNEVKDDKMIMVFVDASDPQDYV